MRGSFDDRLCEAQAVRILIDCSNTKKMYIAKTTSQKEILRDAVISPWKNFIKRESQKSDSVTRLKDMLKRGKERESIQKGRFSTPKLGQKRRPQALSFFQANKVIDLNSSLQQEHSRLKKIFFLKTRAKRYRTINIL